jgi:GntR family transcriptional regulator, vanillate catabolism transcriptional regulator
MTALEENWVGPLRKQQRLVDQVAAHLREGILGGELPSGTPLIQEELAEKLGVSRTPLREAFRILERDGLVRSSPRSNTVLVAEFTDEDVTELYQIREVLDGLAARLAATRHPANSDLVQLARYVTQMSNSIRPFNTPRYLQAHVAFHLGIVELSGNKRLRQQEPVFRISAQMLYGRLSTNVERLERSNEEHQQILDAIAAGDGARAEKVARQHIKRALAAWGG